MATVAARRKPESGPELPETLADLLRRLGNIPTRRVPLQPASGTATERDVLLNNESTLKTAICELCHTRGAETIETRGTRGTSFTVHLAGLGQ